MAERSSKSETYVRFSALLAIRMTIKDQIAGRAARIPSKNVAFTQQGLEISSFAGTFDAESA